MARKLLRVPVSDGKEDFIEVEVNQQNLNGVELISDEGNKPEQAPFTLAASMTRIMPAINTIMTRLRSAEHAPDEIGMELGLTIGGETGLKPATPMYPT